MANNNTVSTVTQRAAHTAITATKQALDSLRRTSASFNYAEAIPVDLLCIVCKLPAYNPRVRDGSRGSGNREQEAEDLSRRYNT